MMVSDDGLGHVISMLVPPFHLDRIRTLLHHVEPLHPLPV